MSSTALSKAVDALKAKNESIKRFREKNAKAEGLIIGAVAQLGGAGAAGVIDARYGDAGKPHKLFDTIPTAAAIGVPLVVAAIAFGKSMPGAQMAAVNFGASMSSCALYRYLLDNVDHAG